MMCPPPLADEPERLAALHEYGFGDEHPLPTLGPVVDIAANMFRMPVAAVNMVGSDHVFFAASRGVGEVDMSRDVSFCAHAILREEGMVVRDTTLDERFHDNPLVTGPAELRFYAGVPIRSASGQAMGALCVIDNKPHPEFSEEDHARLRELAKMAVDRLELRRIEIASEREERGLPAFLADAATPVIYFDKHRVIVDWNEAAARLHGYERSEGVGLRIEALLPEREHICFLDYMERAVAAGTVNEQPAPLELAVLHRSGAERDVALSLFSKEGPGGVSFRAVLRDVTRQREVGRELYRLANFDMLTGLPNRAQFYRRVEEIVVKSGPVAIVMIDLDGFKDVNDTLGHSVGDQILIEMATRIARRAGVDGLAARIGGDEFALLLTGIDSGARASDIAEAMVEELKEPILVDGHEVRVPASCGVALCPQHAEEALQLIENADLALFKAKGSGRGRFQLYHPSFRMEAAARRLYAMELHRAVGQGEFILFYQPQVRLSDGSLVGAEALIRWLHPLRGLLSPAAFLPALEGSPLAATVGAWVIDEACAQAALWRRGGLSTLRIGVNIFAAQFHVGNLTSLIMAALKRHGLPPEALEIEVTENIALEQDESMLRALEEIRALGVGIAFDDFGTGYASLGMLRRFPLSRIKIDRSFVKEVQTSGRDAALIQALVDMSRGMGIETIAEGIETEEQEAFIRNSGCMEGQGYLFGKPMSSQEFGVRFGFRQKLNRRA